MRRKLLHLLSLAALASFAVCSLLTPTSAQEQPENSRSIWFLDSGRCYLAGKKTSLLFSLPKGVGQLGEVAAEEIETSWFLVANGRTLARGNGKPTPILSPDGSTNGSTNGSIMFAAIQLPTLNESVTLAAELQISWTEDGQTYRDKRPITIYSDDPFSSKKKLFEQADIQLFDPIGKTAERLDAHEIPYAVLPNLNAIDSTNKGIVLVGEGVSLREQRQLAEALLLAAQRGLQVLCLAPLEGDFPLTVQSGNTRTQPSRVLLERDDFVYRYDKRFDSIARGSLWVLTTKKNAVIFRAGAAPDLDPLDSWALLTCDFPARSEETPGGRLIVCSAGIIQHWQTSPVPRYLFIHFVQELSDHFNREEEPNVVSKSR